MRFLMAFLASFLARLGAFFGASWASFWTTLRSSWIHRGLVWGRRGWILALAGGFWGRPRKVLANFLKSQENRKISDDQGFDQGLGQEPVQEPGQGFDQGSVQGSGQGLLRNVVGPCGVVSGRCSFLVRVFCHVGAFHNRAPERWRFWGQPRTSCGDPLQPGGGDTSKMAPRRQGLVQN